MNNKLTEKHAKLIDALAEYMDTIKFTKGKVATYRIVILKGKKKGCYDFMGEQLLEGHHEFPYLSIIKRKDLIVKEIIKEKKE